MRLHPLANYFEKKLIRLGQIWLDLGEICANLNKIWEKVRRFGQNQDLASPKTFDLLRLCTKVIYKLGVI